VALPVSSFNNLKYTYLINRRMGNIEMEKNRPFSFLFGNSFGNLPAQASNMFNDHSLELLFE